MRIFTSNLYLLFMFLIIYFFYLLDPEKNICKKKFSLLDEYNTDNQSLEKPKSPLQNKINERLNLEDLEVKDYDPSKNKGIFDEEDNANDYYYNNQSNDKKGIPNTTRIVPKLAPTPVGFRRKMSNELTEYQVKVCMLENEKDELEERNKELEITLTKNEKILKEKDEQLKNKVIYN